MKITSQAFEDRKFQEKKDIKNGILKLSHICKYNIYYFKVINVNI